MHRSLIEWTDYSGGAANFVRRGKRPGDCEISAGCKNCYVERCWRRNPSVWPRETTCYPEKLASLSRWKPTPRGNPYRRGTGSKPMVFVCDTGDLFHDAVPDAFIVQALSAMAGRPDVDWQILTKRAARMVPLVNDWLADRRMAYAPTCIWFGTTVEWQRQDWRVERLLSLRSFRRWLSVEPMIGALDLVKPLGLWVGDLAWVVVGGESGSEARPMHPDWARQVRDLCQVREVPFFFKQWGEWAPWDGNLSDPFIVAAVHTDGSYQRIGDGIDESPSCTMARVGRKRAGRVLDGREWNEFPEEDPDA